ncbi:MAG: alkaline phosphatase [Saprospiraceae bacterium]|nr:alkaline phosphatase [Saprospiraceae bacterium]
MIGDGMGLSALSVGLFQSLKPLNIERFPVVGLHKSYSFDDLVTDSAAGATAFACGIKTYNNAIGVNKDTVACKTILEEAEERGLATGMIATSSIVHATPASFAAHEPLRVLYEEIAADFMSTEMDLLIGGGKKFFDRRNLDERDLVSEWRKRGYKVWDYSQAELRTIELDPRTNLVYFTADNHPLHASLGRDYLPDATQKGLNFLAERGEKGFFIMIEGSQIDWAAHANEGSILIDEVLDFDKAIGLALDFAQRRGDTLVLVTADHESGGVAINPNSSMGKIKPVFTTNGHTGALIPVFAYGPKADMFAGVYENTSIYFKMKEALGW